MGRNKTQMPPFDSEEIKQMALSLIARHGGKKEAERAAMHRQVGAAGTPSVSYWLAIANAIRRMK